MSSMIAYKAISVFTSHTYLAHLRRTFTYIMALPDLSPIGKSSPYSVFLNQIVRKSSYELLKQLVAAIATLKR